MHKSAPLSEEYLPAAHSVHTELPATPEKEPNSQVAQVAEPEAGVYCPTEHN